MDNIYSFSTENLDEHMLESMMYEVETEEPDFERLESGIVLRMLICSTVNMHMLKDLSDHSPSPSRTGTQKMPPRREVQPPQEQDHAQIVAQFCKMAPSVFTREEDRTTGCRRMVPQNGASFPTDDCGLWGGTEVKI